jgi:hypothetical protein
VDALRVLALPGSARWRSFRQNPAAFFSPLFSAGDVHITTLFFLIF